MYDIDCKTSNSSIIKPFQRIFSKNNSPNSQATPSTFLFKHNYTLANRISFVQKKKESFGLKCIQRMSLYGCLYSHKNYIQHKSISKIKILRPFGLYNSSNGKEQPMWNRGSMEFIPTPSLKLGSDWDSRLNPVPHYSYYKNVRSLFSHYNYTKSNRSSFVQMKKRDLRIL